LRLEEFSIVHQCLPHFLNASRVVSRGVRLSGKQTSSFQAVSTGALSTPASTRLAFSLIACRMKAALDISCCAAARRSNSAVCVLRGKRNFCSIRFPVRFKCLTDLPPFICEAISFSSPKNDESLVVNGRSLMTGPTTQAQILSSLLLECGL